MKLFTYGTLMDSCSRHDILKGVGAEYLGDYITQDQFHLVHITAGKWPAAIQPHSDCKPMEDWPSYKIKGELYELPDNPHVLSLISSLEVGYTCIKGKFDRVDASDYVVGLEVEDAYMYVIEDGMFPWYISGGHFSLYEDAEDGIVEWSPEGPGTQDQQLRFEPEPEPEPESNIVAIGSVFNFNVAENIDAGVLESAVVTAAKDEYTGTTVEGFTEYYQRNMVRLASEARYWYEVLCQAHQLSKVEQD